MKAIGFYQSLPIEAAESFIQFDKANPQPAGHDILVRIEAVALNPVDYKIRSSAACDKVLETPRIIGWDAIGTVEATGEQCQLFKKGDKVFYAGDLTRPGSYAELQLVDERIAGWAPQKLPVEQAVAMPLTALTAWELMLERMRLERKRDEGKHILIIGGAGGVGSIAIQLAKKILGLKVIATASRPETQEWCRRLGADHVVSHNALVEEVRATGISSVDYILDLVDANFYWNAMVELIKPEGHIGSISDPKEPLKLHQLKAKSVSFSWELMFTRSMFQCDSIQQQHYILNQVAELLDNGTIVSTCHKVLRGFSVENFKQGHALLESGKSIGKTVILYR